MNRAQALHGEPKEFVKNKILPALDEATRDFIGASPFCVLATSNAEGQCDASPKGGAPGFVRVLDDHRLLLPDVAGNNLFQSYENVDSQPGVGMLFMIPGCEWTVRVNGRATPLQKSDDLLDGVMPTGDHEDDNTRILQALEIQIDEVYAHCPRAYLFGDLWNTEKIAAAKEKDANRYWMGRIMSGLTKKPASA